MTAPLRVWVVERKEGDGWHAHEVYLQEVRALACAGIRGASERRFTEYVAVSLETYEAMCDAWTLHQVRAGNVTESGGGG